MGGRRRRRVRVPRAGGVFICIHLRRPCTAPHSHRLGRRARRVPVPVHSSPAAAPTLGTRGGHGRPSGLSRRGAQHARRGRAPAHRGRACVHARLDSRPSTRGGGGHHHHHHGPQRAHFFDSTSRGPAAWERGGGLRRSRRARRLTPAQPRSPARPLACRGVSPWVHGLRSQSRAQRPRSRMADAAPGACASRGARASRWAGPGQAAPAMAAGEREGEGEGRRDAAGRGAGWDAPRIGVRRH